MKHFITILFALFILSPVNVTAAELTRVTRVDTKDIIQIYLNFDTPPSFSGSATKRRIDVELKDTDIGKEFQLFKTDEKIVKILTRKNSTTLILSLFFRYEPQNFKLTPNTNNTIVLEVLLGNEYSNSYKNLANKLKGLTVVDRATPDFTNPYILSPYRTDWMAFFSNYESPLHIEIPVKFTPPPFPIVELLPPGLSNNLDILTPDMLDLAQKESWDTLATSLLEKLQTTTGPEMQKMIALTYGEALLRNGDFEGAFKQLYLLKETYKDERIGTYANYLLIWLRARYEDPYIAEYEYKTLEPYISDSSPLAPYFLLSRVETSLSTKEYRNLNRLLQIDTIALPPDVQERIKIREADYWFAINIPVKAYAAYKLLVNSPLLRTQPYSFGGHCSTLYDQRYFEAAAREYSKLRSIISGENLIGLVAYREYMSKLKFIDGNELINDFTQIQNAYSRTDAGKLSAIKKNDLRLLADRQYLETALTHYKQIADESSTRSIKEEVGFKVILIHTLLGDIKTAVPMLHTFLREFQTGNVRITAQALLIDLLPKEIKRLVDDTDYLGALVLAKQNKELFQNNWIDSNFLIDIAKAYHKVGIYDEAQKLYLYLIEIKSADQREEFYLPMIQATFDHGNFSLVEDYAAQYSYNYPEGKYTNDVLLIRIQALVADERLTEAKLALPSPLPANGTFHPLAATIYYRTDNYIKTAQTLEEYVELGKNISGQHQFFLAESLYQTKDLNAAADEFLKISKDNIFYHQSLYRLADINRLLGKEELALTFLEKIVETEENSLWKQYAERDLQYNVNKDKY
ncbi:tetratricopeptide repeat protein [Desulforhopalus sp. 52FAK]